MRGFPCSREASHRISPSFAGGQRFILPPCLLLPLLSLPFFSNIIKEIIISYLRHNSQDQRRTFTAGCPPYVRAGYLTGNSRKLRPDALSFNDQYILFTTARRKSHLGGFLFFGHEVTCARFFDLHLVAAYLRI